MNGPLFAPRRDPCNLLHPSSLLLLLQSAQGAAALASGIATLSNAVYDALLGVSSSAYCTTPIYVASVLRLQSGYIAPDEDTDNAALVGHAPGRAGQGWVRYRQPFRNPQNCSGTAQRKRVLDVTVAPSASYC